MTGSFYFCLLMFFTFSFSSSTWGKTAPPTDPELVIQSSTEKRVFKLSELLKRKDLEQVLIKNDPTYPGKENTYQAIAIARLFEGLQLEPDAVIQFRALDGFSAPVSKERLLNASPGGAVAYVALESKKSPWAPTKPGRPSAGPFYLIWKNAELSKIGPEEWPFMLAAFEIKGSLESLYPQIFPQKSTEKQVLQGFQVFTKNCFACHTINQAGLSKMGPDLNLPMNPTEYLKESALKKLIRNPQDLRHWPESRMSAFPKEILSDEELGHLIRYLKHMAQHRVAASKK